MASWPFVLGYVLNRRNMVFVDGCRSITFCRLPSTGRHAVHGRAHEVEAIDVVYGPYSAEYSGNSMGGVVNITTRMPRKRELYVESAS